MKLEIKEYSNLERKIAIILNFTLLALAVVASIVYKISMGLSNDNYKIFGWISIFLFFSFLLVNLTYFLCEDKIKKGIENNLSVFLKNDQYNDAVNYLISMANRKHSPYIKNIVSYYYGYCSLELEKNEEALIMFSETKFEKVTYKNYDYCFCTCFFKYILTYIFEHNFDKAKQYYDECVKCKKIIDKINSKDLRINKLYRAIEYLNNQNEVECKNELKDSIFKSNKFILEYINSKN